MMNCIRINGDALVELWEVKPWYFCKIFHFMPVTKPGLSKPTSCRIKPSSLWIPKPTITRDNQSATLHWNLLFQQRVENTLHVVGQIPLAKSFSVILLVACWRIFWPKNELMSLADLFVCSWEVRPWPDCYPWVKHVPALHPKNHQRQSKSEGVGSLKIALRGHFARSVSKNLKLQLRYPYIIHKIDLLQIYKMMICLIFSLHGLGHFYKMLPCCVPSIKIFVFFLKPEVPGFCPSIGFVGMVSTAKSPWSFTIPGTA